MSALKSTSVLAISSVVVMMLQAVTIHLYARFLSEGELADYLVVMSLSLMMAPFLSLGVTDGVLYYVGRERNDGEKSLQILMTGLSFQLALGIVALLLLMFVSDAVSKLFLSEEGKGALVWIAALLALSRFTYATYLRYLTAMRRVILPGVLELVVMGFVPLMVIAVGWPLQIEWLLLETALGTIVVWLIFFAIDIFTSKHLLSRLKPNLHVLSPLIGYGVPRVPTILGLILLLSTPVVTAKRLDYVDADVVIIGASMALVRMIGVTNQLMTYVILPRIAWAKKNSPELLARTMWILIAVAFFFGLAISAGFVATGDTVLGFWLHRPVAGIADVSFTFWVAALPFITVYFLRPTIDALHFRAYNTLNVFIAVCVMIVNIGLAHMVFHSPNAIGIGVLVAACVLCALNVRTVCKLTPDMHFPTLNLSSPHFWILAVASVLLILLSLGIRAWETRAVGMQPLIGILLMGLAAGAYLLLGGAYFRKAWGSAMLAIPTETAQPKEVAQS